MAKTNVNSSFISLHGLMPFLILDHGLGVWISSRVLVCIHEALV
jgi:hypothetical protein